MSSARMVSIANGQALPLDALPFLPEGLFHESMIEGIARGLRVVSYFGLAPDSGGNGSGHRLFAVLANDREHSLECAATQIGAREFRSIAELCPQVQLFEREIAEQTGLVPRGHPWLKPVRAQGSSFYRVEGDQIHEVAVGPVHAGIIEPGHFRFQCHGEEVLHLEIALGYQHRGVEQALAQGPDSRSLHLAETLAGDSSIAHGLALCQNLEALSGLQAGYRGLTIRAIALELERLANHTGDLGALAGDVAYLPTASFCGRLRGDFLNMSALLCGNRFGRGLVRPGGVTFELEPGLVRVLRDRLAAAEKDCTRAIGLLWTTQSVMARFEDTGKLDTPIADALGLVGPPARACGLPRDARVDHPTGRYRDTRVVVSTHDDGDVHARARVRWKEVRESINLVNSFLDDLEGPLEPVADRALKVPLLKPWSIAVSLVEGWRGELCHVAITDSHGKFSTYKASDPSFHNWSGLAYALRGQEISDFPLCNKSFNLSYCGHDL